MSALLVSDNKKYHATLDVTSLKLDSSGKHQLKLMFDMNKLELELDGQKVSACVTEGHQVLKGSDTSQFVSEPIIKTEVK